MNIGFDERRIDELFLQFDMDNSGTIDASEFVRYLFPRAFYEIYGHMDTRISMAESRLSPDDMSHQSSETLTVTKEERQAALDAQRRASYFTNDSDMASSNTLGSTAHNKKKMMSPSPSTMSPSQSRDLKDSNFARASSRSPSRDLNFGEGAEVRVIKDGATKGKPSRLFSGVY